jgi:hypothetical protein
MIKNQIVLDKVNRLLTEAGIKPNSVVKSESYLQILVAITNSKSKFKFDIKQTSTTLDTEQKLDRNDAFIVSSFGYGIKAVVSSNFGKSKLLTYPNQTIFPAVTTSGSEFTPDDLMVFWNAALSLKVGNTVHIPALETYQFYYGPETQKSAATNYDQADGRSNGFKDITPQIMLKGSDNIDLTVEAPYFTGIKVANSNSNTVNYLTLICRGFLIKEVTR